jgi:hypothetical protein
MITEVLSSSSLVQAFIATCRVGVIALERPLRVDRESTDPYLAPIGVGEWSRRRDSNP